MSEDHGTEGSIPTEPPPSAPERLRPVGESERIVTLDVLRGFAIFGIFMVNMQFFAMPFAEIFAP
ncbi:MAG: hypothetical protein IH804_03730, partial [Planctomycetes bacterium]|nr:hypothetical protein [Planctomycetota bacterium]